MNQTASLPKQYVEKLKEEKQSTGQTISEIIRRALDLYFKEQGKWHPYMEIQAKT